MRDLDVAGKTVLVRVDFNVPFRPGTTVISDDSRIRQAIPTIEYLLERRCRVVIASHLGRPEGRVVDELRMAPVTKRLSELLGRPVAGVEDCVGSDVQRAASNLGPGDVLMLENLRFHPGEEANDPRFAAELAAPADVYVNDAFGAAHRAHASTKGVASFLPAVAGFLMERELQALGKVLESPDSPFLSIFGGAKVSDKLAVLHRLAPLVDGFIVGGGMAATFLVAMEFDVGDSLVESDKVRDVDRIMEEAVEKSVDVLLPIDVVVADSFSADAAYRTVDIHDIPSGWRIMDIGPRTADGFANALISANTVVWNGPMGVFEWEPFSHGTERVAHALAALEDTVTVVGGGSTAEAVTAQGLSDNMTHVSTGGGASLEFMEGRTLPGVAALMDQDTAR